MLSIPSFHDCSVKKLLSLTSSVQDFGNGENYYANRGECDTNWSDCTAQAVSAWVDGGKNYNYDDTTDQFPPNFSEVGQFTQVVWESTTAIGCSWNTVQCSDYRVLFCEYSPPGNFGGQFPANVHPQ